MKCGKNSSTFLYLVAIIVIVNFNITPIICYDVSNKDSNEFVIESSEQEDNHHQHHHPITFIYGNSEKYPWRQKSYNTIESEERLPSSSSSSSSKIVGIQQQSNQGYNSWEKQNHYKHDNGKQDFNAAKHRSYNTINKFPDNDYIINDDEVYGIENNKRNAISSKPEPKPQHQSLCETIEETISLDTQTHIYVPDHYIQRTCKYPTKIFPLRVDKVCNSTMGFECITKFSKIYLTRSALGSDCWKTETREIPSGCECRWPTNLHGDIKPHYQQI